MASSFRISIAPDRWAQPKEAVEDLVTMRNDLVHHLIEQFDVWSKEGWGAAVRHLENSYGRIDRHYIELVEWATSMEKAREMAASFAQSRTFRDLVGNGIAPNGSFDWSNSGIVRALRRAVKATNSQGWARLDEVRTWVATYGPEQTPEKYGCRSWQQVALRVSAWMPSTPRTRFPSPTGRKRWTPHRCQRSAMADVMLVHVQRRGRATTVQVPAVARVEIGAMSVDCLAAIKDEAVQVGHRQACRRGSARDQAWLVGLRKP